MGATGSKPANAPRTNVRSNSGVNTTGAGAPPAIALTSTASANNVAKPNAMAAPAAQPAQPPSNQFGGRKRRNTRRRKASRKTKKGSRK